MKITVVGGGRMGLPLACVFAKHGAFVTVSDINPAAPGSSRSMRFVPHRILPRMMAETMIEALITSPAESVPPPCGTLSK